MVLSASEVLNSVGLSSLTTLSASGGDYEYIDTSTIHKSVRTQMPGLPSAARYQFDSIWDPADSALVQLKKANDAQEECAMFFQFGVGGPIMVFKGSVGANMLPSGQAHGLVTCQVAITLAGSPMFYAS